MRQLRRVESGKSALMKGSVGASDTTGTSTFFYAVHDASGVWPGQQASVIFSLWKVLNQVNVPG